MMGTPGLSPGQPEPESMPRSAQCRCSDNDIADINADAELDTFFGRYNRHCWAGCTTNISEREFPTGTGELLRRKPKHLVLGGTIRQAGRRVEALLMRT